MELNWVREGEKDICYEVENGVGRFYETGDLEQSVMTKAMCEEGQWKESRCFGLHHHVVISQRKGAHWRVSVGKIKSLFPPYSFLISQEVIECQELRGEECVLLVTSNQLLIVEPNKSRFSWIFETDQDIVGASVGAKSDRGGRMVYVLFKSQMLRVYSLSGNWKVSRINQREIQGVGMMEMVNGEVVYVREKRVVLRGEKRMVMEGEVRGIGVVRVNRRKDEVLLVFLGDRIVVLDHREKTWIFKSKVSDENLNRQYFAEYSQLQKLQLYCYSITDTPSPRHLQRITLYPLERQLQVIPYNLLSKHSESLFLNGVINPEIQLQLTPIDTIKHSKGGYSYHLFQQLLNTCPHLFNSILSNHLPSQDSGFHLFLLYIKDVLSETSSYKQLFILISQLIHKYASLESPDKQPLLSQLQSTKLQVKILYYTSVLNPKVCSPQKIAKKLQSIQNLTLCNDNKKYFSNYCKHKSTQHYPITTSQQLIKFLCLFQSELSIDYYACRFCPELIIQSHTNKQLLREIIKLQSSNAPFEPTDTLVRFLERGKEHGDQVYEFYFDYCLRNNYYLGMIKLLGFQRKVFKKDRIREIVQLDFEHGGSRLLRGFKKLSLLQFSKQERQSFLIHVLHYLKKHPSTQINKMIFRICQKDQQIHHTVIRPVMKTLLLLRSES